MEERGQRLSPRLSAMAAPDADITLLDGLATTRSIRRFLADPVPDADLATILWSATRAPTASNLQPVRYLVLRDGPRAVLARAALGRAFRIRWDEMRVRKGFASAAPGSRLAGVAAAMEAFVDSVASAPVIVLVVGAPGRRPQWEVTDGSSVYPAVQNLFLAARALGYGGVMSMWHQEVEAELRQILLIPKDNLIFATVPLGRPAGRHGAVRRKPLGEVVFQDVWGQSPRWALDPPPRPTRRPAATSEGA